MNLRWKQFEKSTRRKMRAELRKSPANWREYRRVRRPWWRRETNLPPWTVRFFFVPLALLAAFTAHPYPSENAAVELTLFVALASMVVRGGQLLIALRSSPRLVFFAHLPMSKEQVFSLQWRSFLRTSAWSILDFTMLYGLLAIGAGYGWKSPVEGLAMALMQWLVIVCASAFFVAHARHGKLFRAVLVIAVLAVVLPAVLQLSSITRTVAALAGWVPPVGWVLYAMGISPPHNILMEWWTALSLAAALLLLPLMYRRLRRTFVLPEPAVAGERARGAVEARRRSQADGTNPDAFAGITAAIRRRDFLKGTDWGRADWIDRFAARWLTPRERVVMEFLSGGDPRSSRQLARLGLVVGGVALLASLVPRIFNVLMPFSFLFLIYVPRYFYRAAWPGTALRNVNGNNISIFSVYPVGFWQLARVTIKTNLARLTAVAPFLAAAGVVLMNATHFNLDSGIMLAAKIIVVMLGLVLVAPVVLVTAGTNDGTKWSMILLTIGWGLAVLVSGVFIFLAPEWGFFIPAAALLLVLCAVALAVYGRAYNQGWFDLQKKPQENINTRLPFIGGT